MKNIPITPFSSDFPLDVLKWIKNNNSKPKMILKMMQICKFFQYQEFPYFVVETLAGSQYYGWNYQPLTQSQTVFGEYWQKMDLNILNKKLWITKELRLEKGYQMKNVLLDSLLPKLAICDIYELSLSVPNIKFEQFKILSAEGKITKLNFSYYSLIKDMDDNCVPLEDILEVVPNIKQLDIDTNANSFVSHQSAVQKVPSSLKKIYLLHIEKDFNFEECFKFIQNRQEIELEFRCGRDWPIEVVKSVQQLTDTLIDAFLPQFKPPSIYFKGQSKKSRKNLRILKYSYEKKEKNDKKNEGTF